MDNKIGLLICTYNRPEYLAQCLDSIVRADLSQVFKIVVSDDSSTDKETLRLINHWDDYFLFSNFPESHDIIKTEKNSGIARSLKNGIDKLISLGCNVIINLDSDAIVRNDFVEEIIGRHKCFPGHIVTGFNCLTRNADGSERHKVVDYNKEMPIFWPFNAKKSVGGINMCFSIEVYRKYIEPALVDVIANRGNWDHKACINSEKDGKPVICCVPSVVQHIGFDSSMNHREEPDTATDFKPLRLKGVELVCVDCVNVPAALEAMRKSMEFIEYDKATLYSNDVAAFNSANGKITEGITLVKIPRIKSKEEYSDWMIRRLGSQMTSEHALVVQHDGYVLNWKAWNNNWLKYDWIGAPWWYKDGHNVGNGGFSLRSKRLQFIIANDRNIVKTHPEDDVICRQHRKHLEQYGLKWAPEEVAKQFSIEGHGKGNDRHYSGQFGFHGNVVKFHEDTNSKDTIIINQFFGLGDILFCIAIARDYIKRGHKIVWPVEPHYVNIQKHFPDITFLDKSILNLNLNREDEYSGNGYTVLPLRFTHRKHKVDMTECMKIKYTDQGEDWKRWKELTWQRDEKAEDILFKKLGLTEGEKYILVNETFQSDNRGSVKINIPAGVKIVKMSSMEGFTLMDWGKVIENAREIHTVSTSIIYMLEVMEKVTQPVHLYIRKPIEKDHSYYDYLLEKKNYIYMP